jgi:hypothetical protein
MPIERPGFEPEEAQNPKRTIEYKGASYEVFDLDRISESQIEPGDRVFIRTESGNRYMLRRSRGADGRIFVYRENDGFSKGGALGSEALKSDIASVGKPLRLLVEDLNRIWQSTPVSAIELRKGIDAAIENSQNRPQARSFADALVRRVGGKPKQNEPPPESDEHER